MRNKRYATVPEWIPFTWPLKTSLHWRHKDRVSDHQPYDCLLSRSFRRRSKKTSKLRVTGLCVGNSPGTGEFPAQRASNAENVSIWWRHHDSCAAWPWYRLLITHPWPDCRADRSLAWIPNPDNWQTHIDYWYWSNNFLQHIWWGVGHTLSFPFIYCQREWL